MKKETKTVRVKAWTVVKDGKPTQFITSEDEANLMSLFGNKAIPCIVTFEV